jgi:hypothetical protein
MSRLNFGARQEYEYLANYKVLQDVFKKNKISKVGRQLEYKLKARTVTHAAVSAYPCRAADKMQDAGQP